MRKTKERLTNYKNEKMDIFDEFLMETEKEQLKDNRLREQKDKKDYSYENDVRIESCDDCRTPINSHGHCPRCDY